MTNEEKIKLIGQKIMILSNNLDRYQQDLLLLKEQLILLQQQKQQTPIQQTIVPPPPVVKPPEVKIEEPEIKKDIPIVKVEDVISPAPQTIPTPQPNPKPVSTFNFEEWVGSKLITIIGIVILVIGLGIGVKYAIDRDLITPLTRIVLAYVAGGIIIALALKLKKNYKAFSAVLLSGAMASLYFTTFAAYSMYDLYPQLVAFAIMVIFTAFTVFAATVYELEVIGIIGLVGAYAVPMLLSDGSGKILVMFSYMVIINAGILFLSFKKYWQVLNMVAFGLTWLIVGSWFGARYDVHKHFVLIMVFNFLFFIIFYISNMSYKIMKQEKFGVLDVIRIVLNSFIFFGIGYAALENEYHRELQGVFTVCNALIHFVFAYIVFKNKLLDRKLFYLLIALVLSFITIAVPVQLEGNWVTLFWSAEGLLLFGIGRYKSVRFYEWMGYAMIFFAIGSLLEDWDNSYFEYSYENPLYKFWTPVANIYFLTSAFVTASLAGFVYINNKKPLPEEIEKKFSVHAIAKYVFPVLLFIFAYVSIANEISAYYDARYEQDIIVMPLDGDEIRDESLRELEDVALGIFNLSFFCIFTFLCIRMWKSALIRWTSFSLNMLVAIGFIFAGLTQLGDLRDNYLHTSETSYFHNGTVFIYIRYVCIALFAILLFLIRQLLKTDTFSKFMIAKIYTGGIVHFFILIVLSNEMVNINHLNNFNLDESYYSYSKTVYKLGFTVLWCLYSFFLIAWGIFRKNKIARIAAISWFGITLIKLVTFDTWDLSAGYKVIAFVLLGVVLLFVAFLYQKFKVLIFGNDNTIEEIEK